jgi:hypothetical protein
VDYQIYRDEGTALIFDFQNKRRPNSVVSQFLCGPCSVPPPKICPMTFPNLPDRTMTSPLRPLAATLIFSLIFNALQAQRSDAWTLKNNKDGIKVYFKRSSDIHEIKLVTSFQTTLPGLVFLLSEVDLYPVWGYKVAESKLLKKVSDHEMYYYSRLDFPWPFNDRDFIMHTHLEQDPVTKRIIARSVAEPAYLPEKKDVVRIKNAHTQWTILPGTGGWPYVEYYIYSDPGGNMPDWLVNMAIDVGPRETIKQLRGLLKQDKYQKAKLGHIKE